jgi:hypothetical protein
MVPRLSKNQARKWVSSIRVKGQVALWPHCIAELTNDGLEATDVDNVLRCGKIHEEPEPEGKHGEWRYRVHTQRMCVVVQFETETELSVATAWRKKE